MANLMLKLMIFTFSILVSSNYVVHAQPGFISLACGGGSHKDSNGIQWTSDELYIASGETHALSNSTQRDYQLQHLRSFPQGKRNCYVLPANNGTKYLIRASFVYGNYDGLQSQPRFELLIDANVVYTVIINSTWDIIEWEAIIMAKTTSMSVCLGRNSTDTPFLSSLELRPVKSSMYDVVSLSLCLFGVTHGDFGAPPNSVTRYPADEYDRIWSAPRKGAGLSYMSTSNQIETRTIEIPSSVMSTALVPTNTSKHLAVTWDFDRTGLYYFVLYFAELEVLKPNEKRQFNISIAGNTWFSNEEPTYLETNKVYSNTSYPILNTGLTEFFLQATTSSTLPPLINAWEIYRFSNSLVYGTDSDDVVAINDIVTHFNLQKDWTGDPCIPQQYTWTWVNCSTELPPRINAVQLSGKELNGTIPASFGNLSALVNLDLSNNNLNGSIPDQLSQLSNLNELNLTNNNLTGSIPEGLAKKQQSRRLDLSINGNNIMGCQSNTCSPSIIKHSKKNVTVWVIIAVIAGVAILLAFVVFIRRKILNNYSSLQLTINKTEPKSPKADIINVVACRSYSYKEVEAMTNHFEKQIGKGGYGPVYLGWLQKKEVAIKMQSQESHQGIKEFSTEIDMLSRVHHKNLVKLIGYCIEEENMVLIYEFMSNGDLRKCLNGTKCLDWETRLNVALNAAQGLEYLHTGCNPSIIHRDVKSSNILLNHHMEAKVADFGLSKYGPLTGATHVSTMVKGTRGYLDPEYCSRERLTEKSDVYSFGVVILEIISGRPPLISESSTEEQEHITSWARKFMLKGDIESIADPVMEMKYKTEDLWKLAELGMVCCSDKSGERPTMSEVVLQLKELTRLQNPIRPLRSSSLEISDPSLLNPHPR